jgi:hypothetical protein
MKPLRLCRQTLGILFLSISPLFAQAANTVLHYALASGARLEIHFQESPGAPPIQMLLFGPESSSPIALSIGDKEWKMREPQSPQKYIFPTPDNQSWGMKVPSWVGFDFNDSTDYNLRQGMLIIADQFGDKIDPHSTSRFLHIFPLDHILKHPEDADAYHVQEPPRRKDSTGRSYSLALIENDAFSAKVDANLLLSIRDADRRQFYPRGTMTVTKAGLLQLQNSQWTDFATLGKRIQFAPSARNGYKMILVDSRPWGRLVSYGDGSPYPPAPEGPSPEEVRAQRLVDQSQREESNLDAYESHAQQESTLTQTLLKLTGIDKELANPRLMVMGYNLKALEHPIQSKNYYVLTAYVRNKKLKKVTPRSWVVGMDFRVGLVERHALPSKYTAEDLYQLPSGQIILKNGESLDLTPHFSCVKAHPF